MLVLTRQKDEWLQIGDVKIVILKIGSGRVKIGIDAPATTGIARGELLEGSRDERDTLPPE